MTKSRAIIYTATAMAMLIVLIAVVVPAFVTSDAYRSRIEGSFSDSLGLEVVVGPHIGFTVLPGLHITLEDIHIRSDGSELLSAGKGRMGIRLLSLLGGNDPIVSIALDNADIYVRRNESGRFNFQNDRRVGLARTSLNMSGLSISNANLRFEGQQPWSSFNAAGCNLDVRGLHASIETTKDFTKDLAFSSEVQCEEIRTEDLTLSNVELSVNANRGIVVFDPIKLHMFDAKGTGDIDADVSGAIPRWSMRFSLPQFPIDAFFRNLTPVRHATGLTDFSMQLSTQGTTLEEMTQTMTGRISLRGGDLTFDGLDLDEQLSLLESSRNFNLVDVGAFFLAGPVGLAVTRGYQFASLLQGSGGTSEIRNLASEWQVEHGIMTAQDVAMATVLNRFALKGALDLANQKFDGVVVALLDSNGCAQEQQKVEGTFAKPMVEKIGILESLAGPALGLVQEGQDLLSGDKCEVFYTGSIEAPKPED